MLWNNIANNLSYFSFFLLFKWGPISRDFLTHKLKQQNKNKGPSTQVINLFQLRSQRTVTKTKNVLASPCHFLISTYFHFINFLFLKNCQIVHMSVCVPCLCLDTELQGRPLFLILCSFWNIQSLQIPSQGLSFFLLCAHHKSNMVPWIIIQDLTGWLMIKFLSGHFKWHSYVKQ